MHIILRNRWLYQFNVYIFYYFWYQTAFYVNVLNISHIGHYILINVGMVKRIASRHSLFKPTSMKPHEKFGSCVHFAIWWNHMKSSAHAFILKIRFNDIILKKYGIEIEHAFNGWGYVNKEPLERYKCLEVCLDVKLLAIKERFYQFCAYSCAAVVDNDLIS
jgi:hypothetical protein